MRLLLDERALDDLQDIVSWIAKDNPGARATLAQLPKAMERLAELPRLGHKCRIAGTYEWVVAPHVIVYHVKQRPMTVVITGVFHTARELGEVCARYLP